MGDLDKIIDEFEDALLNLNRIQAEQILFEYVSLKNNFSSLEQIIVKTLERIGEGWENGSIALSQVYMCGIICEEIIDKYMPRFDIKRKNVPVIGIGVLVDHHSLGKRIVYSVLRAAGYDLIDLGSGLSVEDIIKETIDQKIEILLISTLMLPSALKIKDLRNGLDRAGCVVKIIAGGAPFRFDEGLRSRVGADATGNTATKAVEIIDKIVEGKELS
jgi:methanogenic corrinoid protein MtbC1